MGWGQSFSGLIRGVSTQIQGIGALDTEAGDEEAWQSFALIFLTLTGRPRSGVFAKVDFLWECQPRISAAVPLLLLARSLKDFDENKGQGS